MNEWMDTYEYYNPKYNHRKQFNTLLVKFIQLTFT